MNYKSDSEETYCSEVEELMKLTTELNNSCGNVPVRRSQRLSQKRLTDCSISENKKSLHTKQQLPHKKEILKMGCLLKTTQDVFSTQDLREARELPLTNLTCKQQKKYIISIPENNEPLNLSMKNMGFANDIFFSQKLRENTDVSLGDLKGNVSNVTIPTITIKEKLLGTQKKSVHLNVSLKSKWSQRSNSSLKTLNIKPHLSCAINNDVIDSQCASVQDFQQNPLNQNFTTEPKLQSEPPNILKTKGRPRKTFTTVQPNNQKRNKCLAKNARQNKLECGQNETTQNLLPKSILPDVYPSHFKYQLPPEAVLNRHLVPYPITITPENTPLYELQDSSSTSPSLPDSLRGIFDTDDIKEILNIDKVSYRLYDYHVQALAVILNLRVEYLCEILDKISQMDSNVLKNFDKAMKMPFVEDRDLFETTPDGSPTSEDIVQNSQSPKDRKLFTQTKSSLRQKFY